MREMFNASNGDRKGARNVALLVTDGMANMDRWLTVPYAVEARIAGVYLVVLAVGSLVDHVMLHSIASMPHYKTILLADNSRMLPDFRGPIFMATCDGTHFTIRYDTIDDLHWKTDRQAASLI